MTNKEELLLCLAEIEDGKDTHFVLRHLVSVLELLTEGKDAESQQRAGRIDSLLRASANYEVCMIIILLKLKDYFTSTMIVSNTLFVSLYPTEIRLITQENYYKAEGPITDLARPMLTAILKALSHDN